MRLPLEAWLFIISFLTLFIGYATGRRIGRREGVLEGIAFAPLELRRRSWEKGACMICGTVAGESKEEDASQSPEGELGEAGGVEETGNEGTAPTW